VKVLVKTVSGSEYTLDTTEMTWVRYNPIRGIVGYEAGAGQLAALPEIVMGEPMLLPVLDDTKPGGWDVLSTSNVRDFENLED